ncbi:EAL domain-containing protein [Alkalicoccus daliensis]|uniref:EAL domain, c-di-GMP-specific phosphodiesterase class I (Or its enzymatically inactive variant) n=1 Tax=Alkalicoccus daliensis TaxID=745820 RepID=A0A1H0ADI2_9BACI|nr:EAL domain-containing protein [Alkalicoccus daliensis]SDN31678.1 EAL domain, c-di-GMP-specific phosphodiesterase class I (or its enzymatically inactive variant) [Alkalicoccus daliensis]
MDPFEVMDYLDNISAYLQPIIDAERYEVAGYEVLGRLHLNERVHSLGPFFENPQIPDEYKWEVDQILYENAVEKLIELPGRPKIFFNIQHGVLGPLDAVESLMEMFHRFEEKGLSKDRVIFEIKVPHYEGELDELSHVMLYMKASGFEVALDDVRVYDTHLDQFSKLEPSIIKVDVSDLNETRSYYTYSEILDTLAFFARKLGASLHFKGIEDPHQLHISWKYGGQFFQGFYLGNPENYPVEKTVKQEKVRKDIHSFIDMHHRSLNRQMEFLGDMDLKVQETWLKNTEISAFLKTLASRIKKEAFRMYICNQYGYQLSDNWIKKEDGNWLRDKGALGKNWSWRVYFLDHVGEMQFNKNGMLSDKYRDIDTNENIRTYSYPLSSDMYIFIDIDPLFLYEKNWFSS